MFQWRLKVRQAKHALNEGRYDEACQVLGDAELRKFLPAKKLAEQLAGKMVDRAEQRINWGESRIGFHDLALARELGEPVNADSVQQKYINRVVKEVLEQLMLADPQSSIERLEQVGRRGVESPRLTSLKQLARKWKEASESADRGDMASALAAMDQVIRKLTSLNTSPGPQQSPQQDEQSITIKLAKVLAEEQETLACRAEAHRAATEGLRTAIANTDWTTALTHADQAISCAPMDRVAAGLKRKAWKRLGLDATEQYNGPRKAFADRRSQAGDFDVSLDRQTEGLPSNESSSSSRARAARELGSGLREASRRGGLKKKLDRQTTIARSPAKDDTMTSGDADRRMLWIDAVGGYLVCLDSEVMIGQPVGGALAAKGSPAIPILADISRRHAVVRRESGTYVLEPLGEVTIDGREVTGPTVLADGNRIQLGPSVRLRFRQPHALSATAVLQIESGHKTAPSADAILLMAESCILGPKTHSHVVCADWQDDFIIFRKNHRAAGRDADLSDVTLHCRTNKAIKIADRFEPSPVEISSGDRIEGEDFALTIEQV